MALLAIELKSIRTDERASEETTAYTAKLLLDGRFMAIVGNEGRGGADRVLGPGSSRDLGVAHREYDELCRRVRTEHPQVDLAEEGGAPMMVDDSLDYVCARIVERHVILKEIGRLTKRRLLFFETGLPAPGARSPLKAYRLDDPTHAEPLRRRILAQHPEALFLNGLGEDAMLKAYKRAS